MKIFSLLLGTTTTFFLALSSLTTTAVQAFDYSPDISFAAQNLVDNVTTIDELRTIFINDVTLVYIEGIVWTLVEGGEGGEVEGVEVDSSNSSDVTSTTTTTTYNIMKWETSVNGIIQDSGEIDLTDVGRELPTSIEVGSIKVEQKQTSTVSVTLYLDTTVSTNEANYQTYGRGISLIPLLFILVMAITTRMVELSLFLGILVGSCIITGSLNEGFKLTCNEFLVRALANEGHVYIILFTVFLSGAVGMMQKSGGMLGFTRDIAKVATTPRTGMFACMSVGILIFFDDYSSVLLAGETMRPLLDLLSVSREKLSFIVDATSAPIAAISPVSSWVGFEVALIQDAIDIIVERNIESGVPTSIPETGFAIFLQSVRYAYYSYFMIGLIIMLIVLQRDFGPMLVAERKVRIYERTDGGPGKAESAEMVGGDENQPVEDQPLLLHNLLIPVGILIVLIFALLVETGTVPGTEQSFMDKIEGSDSYSALLWGTLAAAWLTLILYLLQITIPGTGKLCWPTPARLYDMMPWRKSIVEERGDVQPRFLMSIGESIEAFLYGMGRIFLAIVVLTLAWGSGSLMEAVGVDRLFAGVIVSGAIPFQLLPMLTFVIALLIALATGTSWGTMAILYPLVLVPTYYASDGSAEIFYATTSAVMGGAVAGDHMSPISDTTVISALACDVTLMQHVVTQSPYVFWIVLISIIFGYIPMGYNAYPNFVGVLLGWAASLLFVYVICVPIISPTGRWDPVTMLFCGRQKELQILADDCIKKSNGETFMGEGDGDNGDNNTNEDDDGGEFAKSAKEYVDADADDDDGAKEEAAPMS